ncbi:hypothetical protein ABIA33_003896 [Streptacidiphilus sp. MAP12-16]|jgi:hypothetical protein|uniref:hypothetical protein n=1 Tax=Streptacidiphilus sp. MAP12-16 TaxID=3156300 RepID=UPI0035187FF2
MPTFTLRQNSSFDILYHGLLPGYTARVAIAYQGDAKNSAAPFNWLFYRVTH